MNIKEAGIIISKIYKYRITVTGTTDEIRNLIREVSDQIDTNSRNILNDDLIRLENIVHLEQYTYGIHHRIYYNYNTFMYVPNCSGNEAQKFHYETFKPLFDIAYQNVKREANK